MPTFAKMKTSVIVFEPTPASGVSENNTMFVDSDSSNELTNKTNTGAPAQLAGDISLFQKSMFNGTGGAIPIRTPVSILSNGSIAPADSDEAQGQQLVGITLVEIADASSGLVQLVGPNVVDALDGLGFDPGVEIYLGESGGYTDDPGSFSGGDDSIIKIGVSSTTAETISANAKDLILFPEVVIRP